MPTTTKDEHFRMAFVLDEESLRALTDLLEREVLEGTEGPSEALKELLGDEGIDYRVELSDNTTITTSSLDEVLALPNSPKRTIKSIWISTPFTGRSVRASVRLSNNRYNPVNYELRGDDKEVVSLAAKLDDHLLGLRPWYSLLTRWTLMYVFASLAFAIIVLVLLAAAVMFLRSPSSAIKTLQEDDGPDYSGLFLVGYVTVMALLALLDQAMKRVFPVGTFAIGQGIKRNKTLSTVRGAIVTTVVLTIPVGLLISYLTS